MIRAASFVWVMGLSAHALAQAPYEQFNNGTAGWTVYGDGTNLVVDSAQGLPAPALRATDQNSGILWGFQSPAAWAGNRSCAYGGTVAFSLRVSHFASGTGPNEPDVFLNGGGLTIVYDLPVPTVNTWLSRSIPLLPGIGWKISTLSGPAATEAQIQQVLASFEWMRIRGEFSNAVDTGWIDNVTLGGFRVDVMSDPLTICPGGDATFEVDVLGSGPYLYQWTKNGDPLEDDGRIEGSQAALLVISGFGPGDAGNYVCLVTNPCGTVSSTIIPAQVCSADFNCDDGVDDLDIASFFAAFEAGEPVADVNGDDGIDDLDIVSFFQQFEAGC